MGIETILAEEAAYIARNMYGTASTLEAELREIERRKAEIDAKLNAAKLAQSAFSIFTPASGPALHALASIPARGSPKAARFRLLCVC
jgi:hypothetical protein